MVSSTSGDSCTKCDGKSRNHLVRPSELPIYDKHCLNETKKCHSQLKHETNFLEEHIKTGRLAMTDVWGSLSGSTSKLVNFFATGKAHTIGTVYYLREDANVLPRIGAIAAGALTGLLLGIRGKLFKRLIYSSVGAGAVASVCYPNEAKQISKSSYKIAKYYAIIGYNRVQDELSTKKGEKVQVMQKDKIVEATSLSVDKIAEKPIEKPSSQSEPPKSTAKVLAIEKVGKDFGQSNPEDKDMYTTRSS